jgi:hypothetical protein
VQQNASPRAQVKLLDDLISAGEHVGGTSRTSALPVFRLMTSSYLGRLLARDVAWLRPAQNLVDIIHRVGTGPVDLGHVVQ